MEAENAPPTAVDISDGGVPRGPTLFVAKHPPPAKPGAATISMPMKDRKVPVRGASDGTLAGSVLELAQTLTKNNAILREVILSHSYAMSNHSPGSPETCAIL